MNDKNIFSENKVKKSTMKYFVISFSIFIVVLAVCSVVILMYSLDFDIGNLVENSTTTTTDVYEKNENIVYSVNDITGKSNLLFIVENEPKSVDYIFIVSTDFDNQKMTVKCLDGSFNLSHNSSKMSISNIYSKDYELGVKQALNELGFLIDKYVVFEQGQFEDILSLFNGFSVNVKSSVNYKSSEINLTLEKGIQELSPDLTYKYLRICDITTRENVICDIIKSVLTPEYAEKSDKLFTAFVNSCKTDISVIDYSECVDNLKIYCNAQDKFLPETYVEETE